ncbi:nucleoside 2-deoxyribosyltransferase [Oceanidesulfovibrio marinus]|uniref:nucleoside 2-deoxyribosyltransferase n=1 Tax=Oceanidesulfovibrio marinus TaxID=370038 RepID=UPI002E27292F
MINIYQAGPLFTQAEQDWHRKAKAAMEEALAGEGILARISWPGEFFSAEEIRAWGPMAKFHIFNRCMEDLQNAQLVVALLDGVQVDDGTAFEMGAFYTLGRGPILGIRTDFRNAGDTDDSCVNVMLECSCKTVYRSLDALTKGLVDTINEL